MRHLSGITASLVSAVMFLSASVSGREQDMSQAVASSHAGSIETPRQARAHGLESLRLAVRRDGGVPAPSQLDEFVKDRRAAAQLGKALFWDMQVGSDGVQACASCHFHAGADDRTRNLFNPDLLAAVDAREGDIIGYSNTDGIPDKHFEARQPNGTITREDFPLVKTLQELNRTADGAILPGNNNSNDIISSMGVLRHQFNGVQPGSAVDAGTPLADPIWNVGGQNVRRVEPRNAPSVINAIFNFTNFWEGRANPHFNGNDVFGEEDQAATIFVNRSGQGLVQEPIALDNASLASQTMDPPVSTSEMSFGSASGLRVLNEVGIKLLRSSPTTGARLIPLGLQEVRRDDSVLGPLSNAPHRGLSVSYEALIKRAFHDRYWNSKQRVPIPSASAKDFSQMEANFPLFFGIAIQMYESTLVADQTPFDRWMETGRFNSGFGQKALAGLNLFVNQGHCVNCHAGPELTKASVRQARGGNGVISAMTMASGSALYDTGFYNISVTPTTDDVGRGSEDLQGLPLAFSRQALYDREHIAEIDFPIIGNDHLPAKDEDHGTPVCQDLNHNGVCDAGEAILPQFQRVAVDGAFKAPGLRNVELTGPYFHNGGMATLRQVVQFYNHGGNFCRFNSRDLAPSINPLGLNAAQERQLVSFLVSLTDERVRYQAAPFDHPELRIPVDGLDVDGTREIEAVGAGGSSKPLQTFLDLDPDDAIFTPAGVCSATE